MIGDSGPDWLALPSWRSPRWYLPMEPAEKARASLFVFRPVTRRSRVDLFHFFVQSLGELRRPTRRTVLDGLKLRGPVGKSIEAHAAGAVLDPNEAKPLFREYLRRSSATMEPGVPRRALRIRHKLARMES